MSFEEVRGERMHISLARLLNDAITTGSHRGEANIGTGVLGDD
jgi:hypothetical protein